MAREISFDAAKSKKTYATRESLKKTVDSLALGDDVRYLVLTTPEGRFYPVFMVNERSAHRVLGLVHIGFCVAN